MNMIEDVMPRHTAFIIMNTKKIHAAGVILKVQAVKKKMRHWIGVYPRFVNDDLHLYEL